MTGTRPVRTAWLKSLAIPVGELTRLRAEHVDRVLDRANDNNP